MSPCGMWTDILRTFYRMPCRVVIGGVPYFTWIRYYKAPAGAKKLPFPSVFFHGQFHSPNLRPYPVGEIGFPRVFDRGINPGYKGQQYMGLPEWYATGELPAWITDPTIPLPPVPDFCCTPPARGSGGLILGGQGQGANFPPARGSGGLVLGGVGIGASYPPARGSGGLVLGGTGVGTLTLPGVGSGGLVLGGVGIGASYPPAVAAGGLVLGGAGAAQMGTGPAPSAYSSGSFPTSGETTGCDQCPNGAARQYQFTIAGATNGTCVDCASANGTWTVTYLDHCEWTGPTFTLCGTSGHWRWLVTSTTLTLEFSGVIPISTWTASMPWDCLSPIVLNRVGPSAGCTNLPLTITLTPV